ncbi:oxidoreductase [Longirhabdus pacifica]|uniref:oxidoreductase n=1 Tax=Longirhabdus pacifica TaxID=2305227 RepID=UPI0010087279|nr:FAD-dependent oxidoreductase [Longirhabdus pacifica]
MLHHVFQPMTLAGMTIPNRIIMGSMHVALEALDDGVNRLAQFYAERAKGGVGLIITGGIGVCPEGGAGGHYVNAYKEEHIEPLSAITEAVHRENGKIAMQLFHTGRYAYSMMTGHPNVAPSALQAPINPDVPKALTAEEVEQTIGYFANSAKLAKKAGFDAVEIMGSEGYLINQFLSPVTNIRTDEWGGSFEKRARFGVEVAKAVREAVGDDFPVIFRMSGLDLIPDSTTMEETVQFAKMLEEVEVDALNIGIGWHESKVPTIYMSVPRASYVWVAKKIKDAVNVPVIASNRINDVRLADKILSDQQCDLVSMARPLLADAHIVNKSKEEQYDDVNTCIACNQACLDHVFQGIPASCLVNPMVGREVEWEIQPVNEKKKVAVIGGGPAGMEAARVLGERGHNVVLFEKNKEIGGQLLYAVQVPGKQEFNETLRYYTTQFEKYEVDVRLGCEVNEQMLLDEGFDDVVLATGVVPRVPQIPGIDLPHVTMYSSVFEGRAMVGEKVAIIGGGGIACDISHFLLQNESFSSQTGQYLMHYGIVDNAAAVAYQHSGRQITLLRRGDKFGEGLGKTTRWAVLSDLKREGVNMIGGIEYDRIVPEGIIVSKDGQQQLIEADTVIVAAGSTSDNRLQNKLEGRIPVHVIGGAKKAGQLDAKRAIYEGAKIARKI